jgi:hypothetical protein
MPVRITPKGVLLITWDDDAQEWVSLGNTELIPLLNERVEIEPGTKVSDIFDAVDRDGELKSFLGGYCSCNVSELHSRPRTTDDILTIPSVHDGVIDYEAQHVAHFLQVRADAAVFIAPETGDRCFEYDRFLMVGSYTSPDTVVNTPLTTPELREQNHAALCQLEVRLDEVIFLEVEDQNGPGPELHVHFTLLDVLHTIYQALGERTFDWRYQKEIEADEDAFEAFRKWRESHDTQTEKESPPEPDADGGSFG